MVKVATPAPATWWVAESPDLEVRFSGVDFSEDELTAALVLFVAFREGDFFVAFRAGDFFADAFDVVDFSFGGVDFFFVAFLADELFAGDFLVVAMVLLRAFRETDGAPLRRRCIVAK